MLLIKLAFRNIFAHSLRSVVLFIIICSISILLFLFLSFSDGQIKNYNERSVLSRPRCDIIATKQGYWNARERGELDNKNGALLITNYQRKRKLLNQHQFIEYSFIKQPVLSMDFIIKNIKYTTCTVIGVDSKYSKKYLNKLNIVEGDWIETDKDNNIFLHVNSKKSINVKIGDTVTISGNDLFGQSVVQVFYVKGFYKPKIDNNNLARTALVQMQGYNSISGYYDEEAYFIYIDIKNRNKIHTRIRQLQSWADNENLDIEFHSYNKIWRQEYDIYKRIRKIIIIICIIIICVFLYGIMTIISANLADRKREIGTLYCLGAEKYQLTLVYSIEMVIIIFFSSIFGLLSGMGIREIINSIKITTSDPGLQQVFASETFYLGWSLNSILWILSGMLIITSITAGLTLSKGLKVSPVESLKEIN